MKRKSLWLFLVVVALSTAIVVHAAENRSDPPQRIGVDLEALLDKAQTQGHVPLIVGVDVPGYSTEAMVNDTRAAQQLEAGIAQAQNALLDRLSAYGVSNVRTFDFIPFMALSVDADAVQALYADPFVTSIEEDVPVPATLSDSIPLIKANWAHSLYYTGSGQTVAILDSGVDKTHSALSGKVVSEACYSDASKTGVSLCPGGVNSSTVSGSGVNCSTAVFGCDHGTHVAGIAAGVAPNANIIAIQVFTRFTNSAGNTLCTNTSPCVLSNVADQVSALNRVYALRNAYNIASVNMSLGGGQFFNNCDATESARKSAISLLRNAGIITVIAAGNSSYTNSMGAPACITLAFSVGATNKNDAVASYSNLSSLTTLLAPGTNIYSTIPGNSYTFKDGTSMAAPHVAGALAVLRQASPNASITTLTNALTSSGPLITDQRTGGTVTKRRLDVYGALCALITCDGDDFRTVFINTSTNGTTSPSTDRDHFNYNGVVGQRLTIQLNRLSGSMDPYLELIDPDGIRVASNNNGGVGGNALINGYYLQKTGRYLITTSSANSSTGTYQLQLSSTTVEVNPLPKIASLNPTSATATISGSDFWVRIYGQGFVPETQVYWNGSLRTASYSSSTLVWIRVRGSDINFPAPRVATIQTRNPEPGGGYSNPIAFNVNFPFLGVSELVAPAPDSNIQAGVANTFVISWTHPISSWRTMQNMDLRLRDADGETAMWLRISEANPTSTLSLLNSGETPIISTTLVSGQFGSGPDLSINDGFTLHATQTHFFGSGQTIVFSPTITFSDAVTGTYNVEFRVDNEEGEVQADDVLGVVSIRPASCAVALSSVTLNGPATGAVNTTLNYSVAINPGGATGPITYQWSPEPNSGQGTANASYSWSTAGEKVVSVIAENCGAFAADVTTTSIRTTTAADLSISKEAPAVAVAGERITYTLTITNSGATTANSVVVSDVIPSGAFYVTGGSPSGNQVSWSLGSLSGYGTVTQTTFIVTATSTITNSNYTVKATGGINESGAPARVTRIVDATADVGSNVTDTLAYNGGAQETTSIEIPEGVVFDDTTLAYDELSSPTHATPSNKPFAGRAFTLDAYQNDQKVNGFGFADTISVTLTYSDADVAGLDERFLVLHYWTGSAWSAEGVGCTRNTSSNTLTCSLLTPPSGEFALLESIQRAYLPNIFKNFPPSGPFVQINSITTSGGRYNVFYQTYNYTPQLPGTHIHFFFDTVPPSQAGMPGSGPWVIYAGPVPFTGYLISDRPGGANQMCALVANPNHSVQLDTGNCFALP